ncbi:hypothetical protein [Schinkia azotoformans]|uniref:hypothetical protein n=1 Tax=Schinkia azotoformans TaxID=1454 RepID=UPI002DB8B8AD|nr:hypothetical protein [Schinkia azotoformans]MEC1716497.1 hypothetical protein [Schinkia azotoformans]MEC1759106.1 hypothetical protein [Schinkia azotoformans]
MGNKKETILLLKVSNAIREGKTPYEATRGNWKIGKDRIEKDEILYVAGLDTKNKEVVGFYSPEKWFQVKEGPEKEVGRRYFDGVEAPNEIFEKLNKSYDQLLKRFGQGSEKAYITLEELEALLSPTA